MAMLAMVVLTMAILAPCHGYTYCGACSDDAGPMMTGTCRPMGSPGVVFLRGGAAGAAGAAATGADPSAPNPIESAGGPPLRGRGAEALRLEPGGRLPLAMSGFSALGWIEVGPQPSPPPCSAVIAPRPCRPDTAAAAAAAP